jgi:hypothetical protein
MNANYLSVSELKEIYCFDLDYSGIPDTTVSGLISSASRYVDNFTYAPKGWDFEAVVDEEYDSDTSVHTDADNNLFIPLIKRPLAGTGSVQKITIALGAAVSDLTLASGGVSVLHSPSPGWNIIYPGNFLASVGTLLGQARLYSLRSYRYFVRVSYSGGYQEIPSDMKQAVALLVRQALSQRFNSTGAVEVRQGSMDIRFTDRGVNDQKPFLVGQAEILLRQYLRVT